MCIPGGSERKWMASPGAGIFANCFAGKGFAPGAEMFLEEHFALLHQICDSRDAQLVQLFFCDFAHARNFADVERCEEICFHARQNPEHTVGLGLVRSNFGDQARSCDADGAIQFGPLAHALVQGVGGAQRRAVQTLSAGEVEVGFVDGSHFQLGCKGVQ